MDKKLAIRCIGLLGVVFSSLVISELANAVEPFVPAHQYITIKNNDGIWVDRDKIFCTNLPCAFYSGSFGGFSSDTKIDVWTTKTSNGDMAGGVNIGPFLYRGNDGGKCVANITLSIPLNVANSTISVSTEDRTLTINNEVTNHPEACQHDPVHVVVTGNAESGYYITIK